MFDVFYIVGSDMYLNSTCGTLCCISIAWLRGRAILLRHRYTAYLVVCSYLRPPVQSYSHLYDGCNVQYTALLVKTYKCVSSHRHNTY